MEKNTLTEGQKKWLKSLKLSPAIEKMRLRLKQKEAKTVNIERNFFDSTH